MYKTKAGKIFNPGTAKEIAVGGEGKIFELNNNKVIKIYHQPRPASFGKHLELLRSLGTEFVKPEEIYFDGAGKVAGFDMQYVNFNNYWLFNNLFNKGFCNTNGIDKNFKISVLIKMKVAIEAIHSKGIVVGDLNQYNLFVSKTGDIVFVDVDSYSTASNKHNGVLLDDIRDFTTINISKETDSWAYDILSFWATTLCHPFKWVVKGNKESLEQRIKAHKSFLSKIADIIIPPLYEAPIGDTAKQFAEIFNGRRYMIDFAGVHVPVSAVVKQQVVSVSLNIVELMTDVKDVLACRTSLAIRKDKWIFAEVKTHCIMRQLKEIDCDILFPAHDIFAYKKGNDLYDWKGVKRASFIQPEFYYCDSSLSVIDYATDTQRNFNLNNQMSGIDCTQTNVFAKSITVRDTAIQNFGGKQMFNIPYKNIYVMVPVPHGTKNGYYTNNFLAVEYKKKSTVKYEIMEAGGSKTIDFDYFPWFAVKKDLLFVPENGYIEVYKEFQLITKLDANICTRDSKLFSTDAGIILFENKTIYLLNTKQ